MPITSSKVRIRTFDEVIGMRRTEASTRFNVFYVPAGEFIHPIPRVM